MTEFHIFIISEYVESINEIIKIDRSNETFFALLSCGAALFSMF